MNQRIAIFGSGAIGCYVGAWLRQAGAEVVFIGSERMRQRVAAEGLTLSDMHQRRLRLEPAALAFRVEPDAMSDADLVLVCVKSGATRQAAEAVRAFARPSALVVSLQNGIGNARAIAEVNPLMTVLGGMVPFNVAHLPGGRLHRATEGEIMVQASPLLAPWLPLFAAAGLPLSERADFAQVQWGKLLLNLNNPINALSGVPLASELGQRDYRRCLALLIGEALQVLRAAGIQPTRIGKVKPAWLPALLNLPDWAFRAVAGQMLRIDPAARSSMWDDLQAGKPTEIDFLCGEVVALAASLGREAPASARITALVHAAEGDASRMSIDGARLWRLLNERP
jgi:2-dehydropantoate 2-reductase